MSDLNVAFISDDLASGFVTNLVSDIDSDVNATVHCNNLHKEDFVLTTYSVTKPNLNSEESVQECVWETCYAVPVNTLNSNASKRKQHEDGSQELVLKSGHSLKTQNHAKQKNGAKSKKRKANNKREKFQHFSPEKTNLDNRNDLHLVVEANDANRPVISSIVARECVENEDDHMTELAARFESTQEIVGASDGGDVNLSQRVPVSTSVGQEDLVRLPDNTTYAENSDENKNVLKDDIMLEKDCREKVEMLPSNATVVNFAPSNIDHTVECRMDNCVKSAVTEHVPSTVEENILECQQQKKVVLKKNKRRRSHCVKPEMNKNLEQQNEKQVCSEPDGLSATEDQEGCAGNTAVQGA